MAERPYMRLRGATGTLPGRNPFMRTRVLHRVQTHIDLGVEFGGRNDHLEFALETFGQRFGNLHRSHASLVAWLAPAMSE